MQLTVISDGDPTLVRTEGQVPNRSTAQTGEPLAELLGADVYRRNLLLDMSNADYLDSSGVGWLLQCHKRFREAGGKFVIHSMTPMSMQVIRLMRLTQVFQLAPTASAAQQILRAEVTS